MSTRCSSTRPAPSPSATAWPTPSSRCPASTGGRWSQAALLASLSDETPEGKSIVDARRQAGRSRRRGRSPSFIPFSAQHPHLRRQPRRRRAAPQGRRGRDPRLVRGRRVGAAPPHRRGDRPLRRHAAGGRARQAAARRHPPQGHRQAGHPRALRRTAPHGHPHRDDHRRQSADRGGHRRRGRRRRFPRRGDAGEEAGADPQASRPAGGWSPCAATAPTTRRRSPRPISA